VVVNCEALKKHMIEDEGVPGAKVHLCYNGVDATVFHPGSTERPAAVAGASLVIGIVCALRTEKRLDLLLTAFSRVRGLRTGMKLLVVGSGPLLTSITDQARSLGIEQNCVFQPATSEVADWMRAIDIFVLPSSSEAFSNALLEAMASGCCPVGSRVGGTPELIAHGERGLLFESGSVEDLAEKLATLIQDERLRSALAAEAVRFTHSRLSMRHVLENMEEFYAGLLGESTHPTGRFATPASP
jgi:glycosyltransferase involved in cell wall biosynthesis